ncbi:MAG TPA: TIGR04211 family SH3 domain-containing protein [Woeseiaceae bacterium]|nr:TIGR04211 family SH3 domain-containing protein [Woeseiaceae bacterium]
MRLITVPLLIALFLVLPSTAIAETAYVTDQLRLGLHRAEDTSDRSFRTLQSGQELEILSQTRNYAQVRLPDGTVGYVKVAYLVTDKPAALIVNETQAENERLQQELARTKAQFAGPAETIASLEGQLAEQQAELEEGSRRIAELQEQNDSFVSRAQQFRFSLPASWVAGATGVCLVAGFLFGLWWIDYRSRKRHGGFRIY